MLQLRLNLRNNIKLHNSRSKNTLSFKSIRTKAAESEVEVGPHKNTDEDQELKCVGPQDKGPDNFVMESSSSSVSSMVGFLEGVWEWGLLISPFFFWGTAMVAMNEVLPKAGLFFVTSFRLVPAGLLLVGFGVFRGREFPSGFNAWFSICLFAIIDTACFQDFFLRDCPGPLLD